MFLMTVNAHDEPCGEGRGFVKRVFMGRNARGEGSARSPSIIRVETASHKVLFEEEGPGFGNISFRVLEFSLINFYRLIKSNVRRKGDNLSPQ